MRRILTVLLLFVVSGFMMAQTTAKVTFNLNMGVAAKKGTFKVGTDKVFLAGDFNSWSGTANECLRTNSTADTVYSTTLTLNVDSTYHFKFLAPGWENDFTTASKNREYKVKTGDANNILTFFFNDDKTYPTSVKNVKVTFKVNMELEIAKGFFDISKDRVNVRGSFNGWGGATNIMSKALTSNIFSVDTTISMSPTDTLQYKFAYDHNGNTTWESGDNFKAGISATEYTAGAMTVPTRYFDNGDKTASQNAFDVYFQVNVKNAIPAGGSAFPHGVKSVVICGSQNPLVWPAAGWPDSTLTQLVKCYDDGTNGDLVKGDNIWTGKVHFPKYSNVKFEYKYGINYGLTGDNGGVNDNESSVGGNHILTLPLNATVIRTNDVFATMGAAVFTGVNEQKGAVVTEYALEQNYPNPFNPSTVITFSVPEKNNVTLKVFDVLGKEVATLVNGEYNTGKYQVTFNASNLTSGIYFYTIQAGSFSVSKKMMLIK